jgi:hypothetical protein
VPTAYTIAVLAIAAGLAGFADVVRRLPPAAPVATFAISFTVANAAVATAVHAVSTGRPEYGIAAAGILVTLPSLVLTMLTCAIAASLAQRVRRSTRKPTVPATRPLPTLVDLTVQPGDSATLVLPADQTTTESSLAA